MTRPAPLVYVAGPITGNPWGCVRQAADAFPYLRRHGLVPFLPQLSIVHEMVDPLNHEEWLAYNFDVIRLCCGLVRLYGDSPGADREVALARTLGLPVLVAHAGGLGMTTFGAVKNFADEARAHQVVIP